MHAAPLSSWRLQALIEVLQDGRPHSTKTIAQKTGVLAISACVSELRQHGAEITCQRKKVPVMIKGHKVEDRWVFFYTMLKGPDDA